MTTPEDRTSVRIKALEAERLQGPDEPPVKAPKSLPLSDITTEEAVFQPRDMRFDRWDSEAHIKELVGALKDGTKALEPIAVWWSGKRWVVVDGHHRREAYLKELSGRSRVPVKAVGGGLQEAIRYSVSANQKNKLAMTPEERSNSAWRMVCVEGAYTVKEVTEATGVSTRTVKGMRKVLKALRERDGGSPPIDLTWAKARLAAQGKEGESNGKDEDWAEEQAQELANKMRKHLGPHLLRKPSIFALAIQKYSPSLPLRLMEDREWSDDAVRVACGLHNDPDMGLRIVMLDDGSAYADDGWRAPVRSKVGMTRDDDGGAWGGADGRLLEVLEEDEEANPFA